MMKKIIAVLLMLLPFCALAERMKDLATIQGVRENQLVGYGLVTGLAGTGDQTTQTPHTVQSFITEMSNHGVTVPQGTSLQLKNIAGVMVTATLPAFPTPGQRIDVTVTSQGNAKSLSGGTLIEARLQGKDGRVYAIAAGNLLSTGVGASSGGASVQVNNPNKATIPDGAIIEQSVPTLLVHDGHVVFQLKSQDNTTAKRVVDAINSQIAPKIAVALNAREIKVRVPQDEDELVSFLSGIENLDVEQAQGLARVTINSANNTIVVGPLVTNDACGLSHGNLKVTYNTDSKVSQPNARSEGETVVTEKTTVDVKNDDRVALVMLKKSISTKELVDTLTQIGASTEDLKAILEGMKKNGCLHGEIDPM
jgi:flagellar P-ring protein precursor FlgI